MLLRHSLALSIAVIGVLSLPVLACLRPAWLRGLRQRLGFVPAPPAGCVWLHCASVGEAAVAARLAAGLTAQGRAVFATATSRAGLDTLSRLAPDVPCALAPLDHLWIVSAVLRRVRPAALVLVETEIWPVLIGAAKRRGVPVVVASGRLSAGSLSRYGRLRFLFQPAVSRIDRIEARSMLDASRFIALGARTGRVKVSGDLKIEPPAQAPVLARDLGSALGTRRWLVAGSTHPGEEAAALDALEHCEGQGLSIGLALAPRHLGRVEEVERLLRDRGRAYRKRSQLGGERMQAGEVLLLDSLGELAALYGRAALAFVGGTLAPVGGHNLLEPIQAGTPVCFGSSVAKTQAAAELLVASGAGQAVVDAAALPGLVLDMLSDPKLADRALAAQDVLERHRGAMARCLAAIDEVIERAQGRHADEGRGKRATFVPRSRRETRLRSLLLSPLALAAWIYGSAASLHRGLYGRGVLRARRLPCRVVSVGSLTAGGSGKTPAAIWVARGLARRGHRVVLLTRGYRGQRAGPAERIRVLSDGRQLMRRPAEAGDEPLLLARHAPGIPVVVARDRGAAGLRAVSAYDADIVVLDDGFQHHRLARDLDLAVFDAAEPLGNGYVLPRGPLRERPSALAAADAVGLLDGDGTEVPNEILAGCDDEIFCFHAARTPVALRPLAGGKVQDPSVLRGMRVGVLAGIARPESLVRSLEALGAEVIGRRFLPDHHRYRPRDLRGLRRIADVWITSEKDAVKILPAWLGPLDLRVLAIQLRVRRPEALLDFIERQIDPGSIA